MVWSPFNGRSIIPDATNDSYTACSTANQSISGEPNGHSLRIQGLYASSSTNSCRLSWNKLQWLVIVRFSFVRHSSPPILWSAGRVDRHNPVNAKLISGFIARRVLHAIECEAPQAARARQPSSSERFSPPFTSTFMPLVPLASQGRRGVFTQTSTPWTRCSAIRTS
jgi:hypothetical protein